MKPVRLARLLAERLEDRGERSGAEVTVRELLEEYVPYEAARGSLDLATKSEYDLLVLEFLADERLTLQEDPALGEAASEELETPEPGLAPLEELGDVALRLDLATISGGYRGGTSGPAESAPDADGPAAASPDPGRGPGNGADDAGTEQDAVSEEEAAADASAGEGWDPTGGVEARPPDDSAPGSGSGDDRRNGERTACRSCGRELHLEADGPVRFCPYCGAARPERECPECATELEPEWTYCPSCGAQAGPSGGGGAA